MRTSSVCNAGGLWSHTAQKLEIGTTCSLVGALATCMPKPNRIVISCDPKFYWGR